MASFGARLRKLRRDRDWTQEYVSNHLSVVRSTYAYYESGKTFPDYKTIIQLASLFDVTTDYLLIGDDYEPDNEIKQFAMIRDKTKSSYIPNQQNESLPEWQLKESEQRLVVAFRHLDLNKQRTLLEMMEKLALEEYDRRDPRND